MKACQWDPRDCTRAGWRARKSFLKAQNRRVFYFLCLIKNVYQGNISFVKTIHILFSVKTESGKRIVTGTCVFSSICIKGVWKKGTWEKSPLPGKSPQENCLPEICLPGKLTTRKIAPWKIVLLDFCCFWHYLTVVPFKTFYSN